MSPSQMSVRFDVTPGKLALAMALAARDAHLGSSYAGEDGDEDPKLRYHVEGMSRTAAMTALRECFWAYGDVSWPDDYPQQAYSAALVRSRRWLNA